MKLQNSEFKIILSKNIDDYWITAYDLSEKSYKMTNRTGKWLVFIHFYAI
ncbi:hypothetical protein LCGC14_0764610 [marine sediment metagenome]|uniref:Uncharacterized protein n=1 Tax=marine sediment metagenome TaxID=412755 RepID=A0A0F9Q0D8_9ZZZZ